MSVNSSRLDDLSVLDEASNSLGSHIRGRRLPPLPGAIPADDDDTQSQQPQPLPPSSPTHDSTPSGVGESKTSPPAEVPDPLFTPLTHAASTILKTAPIIAELLKPAHDVTNPTTSPPISSMTTAQVAIRYNACAPHSGTLATVRAECDMLQAVAVHTIDSLPDYPSAESLQSVVALTAMHNMGVVRAALNKLASVVSNQTSVSPDVVQALGTAIRLAVNAATGRFKFVARRGPTATDIAKSVLDAGVRFVGGAVSTDAVPVTTAPPGATAAPPPTTEDVRNLIGVVVKHVEAAVAGIAAQLKDVSFRSNDRDKLLYSLCYLLDGVVDVMPEDMGPEGLGEDWYHAMIAALDVMVPADIADMYAEHYIAYAAQAVAHVRHDANARAATLLRPTTEVVSGVLRLASAVVDASPGEVYSAVKELQATASDLKARKRKEWYNVVRLLCELPLEALLVTLDDGPRRPPHVTFFVVEHLDAIARCPSETAISDDSRQVTAVAALGSVFMEQYAALDVDTEVRGHLMKRLYRLCRAPEPAVSAAAKAALRRVFVYTEPAPVWRRLLPCVSASEVPVAERLQAGTGVYLGALDGVTSGGASFHTEYDIGAGPLYQAAITPQTTVQEAFKATHPIEAAIELLRQNAEVRARDVADELELYVEPLSSPSKNTPAESEDIASLDGRVKAWLGEWVAQPATETMLMHGHSGSGKSLYCALLEQQLWRQYRRWSETPTPLLITLPSVKVPDKSAVAEALMERCELTVLRAAEGGRRWVVVLDGFDEVNGKSNFVTGNKLAELLPGCGVVVTCRTEYLEALGSFQYLFTGSPEGNAVKEVFVQPFTGEQKDKYFQAWERQHASGWSAEEYIRFLDATPGLSDLASSPFVLRAMADALPLLEGGRGMEVTRAAVYAAFMEHWWGLALEKGGEGRPSVFDPQSYANLSQDLAVLMFELGRMAAESNAGLYTFGGAEASPWLRFFKPDPLTRWTLKGCPLRPTGRMYSFIHKSVAEYFAACAMWGDVVRVRDTGVSGEAGDGTGFGVLEAACALCRVGVWAEPGILSFLVDLLHGSRAGDGLDVWRRTLAALHWIVRLSAAPGACEGFAVAASNVASMMAQAGVSLLGAEWEGVKLRRGVLSDAVLDGADLRGADLSGAQLHRVMGNGADLRGALLTDVSFGVFPTLKGHSDDVTCVCVLPDGKSIVSGSEDSTVRVWDVSTGACTATLEGHSGAVKALCVSPDGSFIVSGSEDDTMRVWNRVTGECTATLDGHTDGVSSVCMSADGRVLVSGSLDRTVRVWNAVTGACTATLDDQYCGVACVSPDGSFIVSGSFHNTVCVWDMATGECTAELEGHSQEINSLCVSADGSTIVSGSDDSTVRVWDVATGACVAKLEGHVDGVMSVCVSADGKMVVSGGDGETVRVWDVATEWCMATLRGHKACVNSVCMPADGLFIVSGSSDKTVRVWDAATGVPAAGVEGHAERVKSVFVSADCKSVVSTSEDKTVRVWDLATGVCTATLDRPFTSDYALYISPDGKFVVSASADQPVYLSNFATGERMATMHGEPGWVFTVYISADCKTVLTGSYDSMVRVWDVATGACTATLEGHAGRVTSVCMSADGQVSVSGSEDKTVRVWDTVAGTCNQTLVHCDKVLSACVSADGRIIVSGCGDGSVYVWDSVAGTHTVDLKVHSGEVEAVGLSPDGTFAVSGSCDKTVRVWDVTTGACTAKLGGHSEEVLTVCVSPDGKFIVSGSTDKTVRVWEASDTATTWCLHHVLGRVSNLALGGARVSVDTCDSTSKANVEVLRQHGAVVEEPPPPSQHGAAGGEATPSLSGLGERLTGLQEQLVASQALLQEQAAASRGDLDARLTALQEVLTGQLATVLAAVRES